MAERKVHNPKTGETFTFLKTARETQGELMRISYAMAPHAAIADEHSHPNQEMTIKVLAGTLTCTVDGKNRKISAGQETVIPAGAVSFSEERDR